MEPIVIVAPTVEPVSAEEFRDHARIDSATEDTLIESYLQAAREYIEARTGRTFHETTLDAFPEYFGCEIRLPRATPLISVTGVYYTPAGSGELTWASSNYLVNLYSQPGLIRPAHGASWPSFTPSPVNPIRVRYVAGLANSNSPLQYPKETIRTAIKLMAAGLYENRESEVLTDRASIDAVSMIYGVEAFINMNKVEWAF